MFFGYREEAEFYRKTLDSAPQLGEQNVQLLPSRVAEKLRCLDRLAARSTRSDIHVSPEI
jgi:hypothetical protein